MTTISFEITNPFDIEEALDRIRWTRDFSFGSRKMGQGYQRPRHIKPLFSLQQTLGSSDVALANADFLSMGYNRLLVVLLEPTDKEWHHRLEDDPTRYLNWPDTLIRVDELLREASADKLNATNTCIFDVRALRFDRHKEPASERIARDHLAYAVFDDMVHRLAPDVIVVCQCGASKAKNTMAKTLSSRLALAGSVTNHHIADKNVAVVYGFHPSLYLSDYAEKTMGVDLEEELIEDFAKLADNIIRYAFHTAINILARRTVQGSGIDEVREHFLKLRHLINEASAG